MGIGYFFLQHIMNGFSLKEFFNKICSERKITFDYHHILRFMDVIEANHDEYLRWLYDKSNSIIKRDDSVMYYDCTNFIPYQ